MNCKFSDSKVVVSVNSLTKTYGTLNAVNDVSFELHKGEVLTLLGPNGSGKTTTLKCILGLSSPTKGSIEISEESAGLIGSVLSRESLHPGRSGYATVRDIAVTRGKTKADIIKALDMSGLTKTEYQKRVKGYSEGMRQRLLLATALVLSPKVLILDEPETGLDPDAQMWLRSFIEDFTSSGGSVLLSTHNFYTAADIATRILFYGTGRLLDEISLLNNKLTTEEIGELYRNITGSYARMQL